MNKEGLASVVVDSEPIGSNNEGENGSIESNREYVSLMQYLEKYGRKDFADMIGSLKPLTKHTLLSELGGGFADLKIDRINIAEAGEALKEYEDGCREDHVEFRENGPNRKAALKKLKENIFED